MRKSVSRAHGQSEPSVASGHKGRRAWGRRQEGGGHLRGEGGGELRTKDGGVGQRRGSHTGRDSDLQRTSYDGKSSPEALHETCRLYRRNTCARINEADAIHLQGVDLSPEMWLVKMLLGPIDSSYDTKGERGGHGSFSVRGSEIAPFVFVQRC
jgi:hypothetical protein